MMNNSGGWMGGGMGTCQENICAFERSVNGSSVMVVVPRFCSTLISDEGGVPLGREVWQDTRILQTFDSAASRYRNIFTGETLGLDQSEGDLTLDVADILSDFPVALLKRISC